MAEEKIKVAPDICAFVDDMHSKATLEITIPGVKKKDIKIKMHKDSFNLSASREDIEYVASLSFCCPVKPEAAKATYDNGLLRIEVPFKDPMEDAVKVPVE